MSEALLKIEEEELERLEKRLAGYGRLGKLNRGRDGMELVRLAGKSKQESNNKRQKGRSKIAETIAISQRWCQ